MGFRFRGKPYGRRHHEQAERGWAAYRLSEWPWAGFADTAPLRAAKNASNYGYFATSPRPCNPATSRVLMGDACQIRMLPPIPMQEEWERVVQVPTLGFPDQQLEILDLDPDPCTFEEKGVMQEIPGGGRYTLAGAREHVLQNIDTCGLLLVVGAPK